MSSKPAFCLTRRAALLGAVGMLAGCGFSPLYGDRGSAQGLRNAVALHAPETPDGYHLRQRLIDRLGNADSASYDLDLTVQLTEVPLGIAADNTATRVNITGAVTYTLRDLGAQTITEGTVSSFTSYSSTSTTVATRAAAQDARTRLMTILADQIVTRLLASVAASGA